MDASEFIVSVNESDFDYEVIAYSQRVLVVVDFWAEWCVPCKVLGPILERLANEGKGRFRLAKVNVDENPKLATRFSVRGIPAVKAFRDGEIVAEFTGALPEAKVREFFRNLLPSRVDLILEKAQSLAQAQDWAAAETAFRQVLAERSDDPAALLGLAKCQIAQGRPLEAQNTLRRIPPSREYAAAETLSPLVASMIAATTPEESDNPLDAAYQRALRLTGRGNLLAALDGILDVLRQEKHYRRGEAHRAALGLLELLGEAHPLTRQYRDELASVLF